MLSTSREAHCQVRGGVFLFKEHQLRQFVIHRLGLFHNDLVARRCLQCSDSVMCDGQLHLQPPVLVAFPVFVDRIVLHMPDEECARHQANTRNGETEHHQRVEQAGWTERDSQCVQDAREEDHRSQRNKHSTDRGRRSSARRSVERGARTIAACKRIPDYRPWPS